MTDEDAWKATHDAIEVTGSCDAGCGKEARKWFGQTSCATCGDVVCIARLRASYEAQDHGPTRVPDDPRYEYTGQARVKQQELDKLRETASLLDLVTTPVGAAFVLGDAGGRINTLHSLDLINTAEAIQLRGEIRAQYDARWADQALERVGKEG